MRHLPVLALALCFSATAFAKDRNWQEAKVLSPTASTGAAVVAPVGSTLIGGYIQIVHYSFQTADRVYVTSCHPGGGQYKCPDVTVNAKTKVAVEGKYLHVLDDQGKDRKILIIEKIAPPERSAKEKQ